MIHREASFVVETSIPPCEPFGDRLVSDDFQRFSTIMFSIIRYLIRYLMNDGFSFEPADKRKSFSFWSAIDEQWSTDLSSNLGQLADAQGKKDPHQRPCFW